MQSLAILGSTGSIGTQALDLARQYPDRFRVAALTARGNKETPRRPKSRRIRCW